MLDELPVDGVLLLIVAVDRAGRVVVGVEKVGGRRLSFVDGDCVDRLSVDGVFRPTLVAFVALNWLPSAFESLLLTVDRTVIVIFC